MRKIGIFTFHNADNYGAVLQCYSLYRYFNKFSKCNVIDYRNRSIDVTSSYKRYYKKYRNILGFMMSIYMKPAFKKRRKIFNDFRKRYLGINGEQEMRREDLKALNDSYDVFVTGSDQVWNLNLTENDMTYFLDFVEDKNERYSYAASIGDINTIKLLPKCITEMMKFNKISVRELSTEKFLKDNYQIYSENNIDPVFLLKKEDWDSIAENFEQTGYLLYFVNGRCNQNTYYIVRKIAKEKNLKIYYMANEDRKYRYLYLKHLTGISPMKFISIIKNAEFIVTDSFHVTAFSLIYEKEFLYDDKGFYNCRVIDLLQFLGVDGRLVSDVENSNILQRVDWDVVHRNIEEARVKADIYFQGVVRK